MSRWVTESSDINDRKTYDKPRACEPHTQTVSHAVPFFATLISDDIVGSSVGGFVDLFSRESTHRYFRESEIVGGESARYTTRNSAHFNYVVSASRAARLVNIFFFASRETRPSRFAGMRKERTRKLCLISLHERVSSRCLPLLVISASHIVGAKDCRLGMRVASWQCTVRCRHEETAGCKGLSLSNCVPVFFYLPLSFFFFLLRCVLYFLRTPLKIIGICATIDIYLFMKNIYLI